MKKFLLFTFSLIVTAFCFAQGNFWKFESEQSALKRNSAPLVLPKVYRTLSLSFDEYKNWLNAAPVESSNFKNGLEISLPYPDNSFKKFKIAETKMMEDALANQFPQIKTYVGQGIDEPTATVRIDYTTQGFHAFVISSSGSLFIDPYQKGNNNLYITYFSKDYVNPDKEKFKCTANEQLNSNTSSSLINAPLSGTCIGGSLRTYRAAISCTGEYAIAVCPPGNVTVANTMSAIITTMNRVNGVYQTELDIKMVLVGANASVIYTNPGTDPYTGNSNDTATKLIDQSQANITSVIGSSNFDIGHTFSTGAGGLADVGIVCTAGNKASGVTGLSNPVGDVYDIDYVAHEIGHQFGATHTFESELNFCGGNRTQSSAYEPGSGTTIMGYANICGSDNIQPNSNPYFHTKSFDQIVAYTTIDEGNTCPVVTATGNTSPVVVMPVSGMKIPKGTPFTLTGSATDINGDALTYSWEEFDLSNSSTGSEWDAGASSIVKPLFKARIPKTSGTRTFPDMAVILANYPSNPPATMNGLKGETLPREARDMKFRLVARDNNANGGGVATGGSGCSSTASFKVVVTDDGPFVLTAPNTAVNWLGGSTETVTWDVANTNNISRINAQDVDILMSTDGGNTYPTTILSDIPNDGAQNITVPNIATNNTVRFMIRASGNIFFDISDEDFTITQNSVLPVSLLQLYVTPGVAGIELKWTTATEFNNKGFEILRSEGTDNKFIKIGFIPAKGNSSNVQYYTLNDNDVKKGIVYFYRLRQVDLNNISVYSDIKRAKINLEGKIIASIQPHPFYNNAELYLEGIDKKDFKIIISDVMGRVIIRKTIKNNEESRLIPIDFTRQASGLYSIKFLQSDVEITVKAVKR
ncbi:MAG: reprolysin-like metallopeptidase [Ginsengibacter sp.]